LGSSLAQALPILLLLVLSFTVHEYAHAWTATRFGDDTAARQGRLTLNPLAHIDLVGTILLPLFLILAHQPVFGWPKFTPVDPTRFRPGVRRSVAEILVSLAGPFANLGLALVATAALGVLRPLAPAVVVQDGPGLALLTTLIGLNALLTVLNLLPLPPLDGGRVVGGLLPGGWRQGWNRLVLFGPILLIALSYMHDGQGRSILWRVLDPPTAALTGFLLRLSNGFVT
jgi:Zn-dependent protease